MFLHLGKNTIETTGHASSYRGSAHSERDQMQSGVNTKQVWQIS